METSIPIHQYKQSFYNDEKNQLSENANEQRQ
jgi:hypothetical protein